MNTMETSRTYHGLGFRDALAEVVMNARIHGADEAVLDAARRLSTLAPENPHAEYVLKHGLVKK